MNMEIANCARCKKVFTRMSGPLCEACEKEEEEIFQSVKKYVIENPLASVETVVTETGVSLKKIQKYLREGRLMMSDGLGGALQCEGCGKPIQRGRYCDTCVIHINQQVKDEFEKKPQKAVMHTRAGDRRRLK